MSVAAQPPRSLRHCCSLCVADCDGSSCFYPTCTHLVCARCYQRDASNKERCPRCQKPGKALSLSAPTFPQELRGRMVVDVRKQLLHLAAALELQDTLEQSTSARARDVIRNCSGQAVQLHKELVATRGQLSHKEEECKTLQVEVAVLRDQLREVHAGNLGMLRHPAISNGTVSQRFGEPMQGQLHAQQQQQPREPSALPSDPFRITATPSLFPPSTSAMMLPGGPPMDTPNGRAVAGTWPSPGASRVPMTPLGWSVTTRADSAKRPRGSGEESGGPMGSHRVSARFHLGGNSSSNAFASGATPLHFGPRDSPLVVSSTTATRTGHAHTNGAAPPATPTMQTLAAAASSVPHMRSLLPGTKGGPTAIPARVIHSSSGHLEGPPF